MPVLSNVLLAVEGPATLRLAATDLYLALAGKVAADVSKGGSVAVSAKDLLERVKMMPDGPIHVATQDNAGTTLKAQGSARRYTLRGMPGDDFPPLPSPAEGAPTLALEVSVLQELIAKTHFSISTDETRAHLNSALFEWDGDVVRMVTTDGHRLSKMEVKVAGRQASETMLIPLKAIQELRRLCDDALSEAVTRGGQGRAAAATPDYAERLERVLPGRRHDLQRQARGRSVPAVRAGHSAVLRQEGPRPSRRIRRCAPSGVDCRE